MIGLRDSLQLGLFLVTLSFLPPNYDLFLCYRRRDASATTNRLWRALTAYRLPEPFEHTRRQHKLIVFRDLTHNQITADLWTQNVLPALDAAKHVLIVLSPAFSEPHREHQPNWAMREIEHLIDSGQVSRILFAQVTSETKLPDELRKLFPNPNIIDVSVFSSGLQLQLARGAARNAIAAIAGPLLGITASEMPLLTKIEATIAMRERVIRSLVGLAIVLSVAVTVYFAFMLRNANAQLDSASKEAKQITLQSQRDAAHSYADLADQNWAAGDHTRAILLQATAYDKASPDDPLRPSYGLRLLKMVRYFPNDTAALPPGITNAILDLDRDRLFAFTQSGQFFWNPGSASSGVSLSHPKLQGDNSGGFTKDGRTLYLGVRSGSAVDVATGHIAIDPKPLLFPEYERYAFDPVLRDLSQLPREQLKQSYPFDGALESAIGTADGHVGAVVSRNAEGFSFLDVYGQNVPLHLKLLPPRDESSVWTKISERPFEHVMVEDISSKGDRLLLHWWVGDDPDLEMHEMFEEVHLSDSATLWLQRTGRVPASFGHSHPIAATRFFWPPARFSSSGDQIWISQSSDGVHWTSEAWDSATGLAIGFLRDLGVGPSLLALVSDRAGVRAVQDSVRSRVDLRLSRYDSVDFRSYRDEYTAPSFASTSERAVLPSKTHPFRVWTPDQGAAACTDATPRADNVKPINGDLFAAILPAQVQIFDAGECRIIETIHLPSQIAVDRAAAHDQTVVFAARITSPTNPNSIVPCLVIHQLRDSHAPRIVRLPDGAFVQALSADGHYFAYRYREKLYFFSTNLTGPDDQATLTFTVKLSDDVALDWLLELTSHSVVEILKDKIRFNLPDATIEATTQDGVVRLTDVGRSLRLSLPRVSPPSIAISRDGWLVAFEDGEQERLFLFDLRTGHYDDVVNVIGDLEDMRFSPDGRELWTAWNHGLFRRQFVSAPWQDASWIASLGEAVTSLRLSNAATEPLDPVEHKKIRARVLETLRASACTNPNAAYVLDHLDPVTPTCAAHR
jgi:hypothetical protein